MKAKKFYSAYSVHNRPVKRRELDPISKTVAGQAQSVQEIFDKYVKQGSVEGVGRQVEYFDGNLDDDFAMNEVRMAAIDEQLEMQVKLQKIQKDTIARLKKEKKELEKKADEASADDPPKVQEPPEGGD
jgi:hypothetical protein